MTIRLPRVAIPIGWCLRSWLMRSNFLPASRFMSRFHCWLNRSILFPRIASPVSWLRCRSLPFSVSRLSSPSTLLLVNRLSRWVMSGHERLQGMPFGRLRRWVMSGQERFQGMPLSRLMSWQYGWMIRLQLLQLSRFLSGHQRWMICRSLLLPPVVLFLRPWLPLQLSCTTRWFATGIDDIGLLFYGFMSRR